MIECWNLIDSLRAVTAVLVIVAAELDQLRNPLLLTKFTEQKPIQLQPTSLILIQFI